MPVEPSFMVNEPSMGPVPSQVTLKAASLTAAETNAGVEVKTIAVDPIVQQLAATSVSMSLFTCDDNYQIASVSAVPEVVGGAAAAVTVERLTGTTAPGSGTAQLAATIPLTANAHTVINGALKTGGSDTFQKGDRVGIVLSGTLTGLVGHITVTLKRI